MTGHAIRRADPREPGATALLLASQAIMHATSPPEARNYLPIEKLVAPDIHFFVAECEADARGCIALAIRDGYCELKSMFVREDVRGSGLADALLAHAEAEAREVGCGTMRLETGTGLKAALRFYERNGYRFCGSFDDYTPTPWSLYMEKAL
ncbi:GNAT family N-acetyltransferase [Tropicimonas marinistellae]|uniref:GNAT family N-acetyltransferase n=1 Tax=Tropicimonas marinistellae TaxID=1739787 RepID=UPI000A3F03DD|nr:GNAT family N-acetyltransferase [Tropicimonas marinistellae]